MTDEVTTVSSGSAAETAPYCCRLGQVPSNAEEVGYRRAMMGDECARLQSIFAQRLLPSDWRAQIDALTGIEDCIRDGLTRSRDSEDWALFEHYVLTVTRHPSRSATPVLCEVLTRRSDQVNNDDIVFVLDAIADPDSVGALVDAMTRYPDWDEFYQLAKKCIWTLAVIRIPEAIEALRDAAAVGPLVVRELAAAELTALGGGG